MHRTLAGALFAALAAAAPAAAYAQQAPRVAIGPFAGARASLAREAVEATLDEHAREVSEVASDAWAGAARQVGISPNGAGTGADDDLARAGRQAGADVVLTGELARRPRGDYVLRVRVLRARDGESVGTASWELANLTEIDSIRGEIWTQIGPYILAQAPAPPAESNPAPAPTPTPSAPPAAPPPRPVEPPAPARNSDDVAPTPGLGLVNLALGFGGAARYYRLSLYGDVSPRSYENPGYAEARADVSALYRWSHDRAGVGVQAWVLYPIAVSSFATDDAGQVVSLPTSGYEFGAGATAAYRPPGGGSLRVGLGFVMHAFDVNTDALAPDQRLAPVTYLGGRVAAEGALPLYASAAYELAVLFGGEFRLVQAGAALRAAFGQQTGLSTGVGASAGLQLRLDGIAPGLSVRLVAEMLRYRVTFAGRSDVARGNDSTDDFVRFAGVLSYAVGTPAAR